MRNWVDDVIAKWRSEGVELNPPATLTDLEKSEEILSFKFPDDFRQLYLVANAFVDYEWQKHMFSFWSLERITNEFNESSDKRFISFCDFLICSHFIGFDKTRSGIYHLSDGTFIAESFGQAVAMINSGHDLIY